MIDVDIILKRDNFDVRVKEQFGAGITGIFGRSGSGKTSLLHAIAGLNLPSEGHINIAGRFVYSNDRKINLPVEERSIGYVFQEGRLFPHLSVEQNLRYAYRQLHKGITFDEVVDLLQLRHILKSKPRKISGGERQRTALGRSLLSRPSLLLLDEPFSGLDIHLRNQILPFLYKIHQRVKIPILVVSHDLSDLLKLTNRLFVIDQGRCLGHGDYIDLLRVPSVRQLLGSNVLVNAIDVQVTEVDVDSGMALLTHCASGSQVRAVIEKSRRNCVEYKDVKLFVRSDDIALASAYVEGISIHNQLEGEVLDVINGSQINVCLVDVGFPLVVEVTEDSISRLKIEKGSNVWCLFKSVSIDMVS